MISSAVLDGDKLTVVISIVNNPGIASMKFSVAYGESLAIESVEFAEELGAYVTSPEPYIDPQTFNWISAGTDSAYEGELVTVTFTVDPELSEGETLEISIIPDGENIFDSKMNAVPFIASGVTVTVNA